MIGRPSRRHAARSCAMLRSAAGLFRGPSTAWYCASIAFCTSMINRAACANFDGTAGSLLLSARRYHDLNRTHLFRILQEMKKDILLGQSEMLVLLAVLRLGKEAYGV